MSFYLPDELHRELVEWAHCEHTCRTPDFIIGNEADPYLLRWYVMREGQLWLDLPNETRAAIHQSENPRVAQGLGHNVYVHRFVRSDDDRALHDHPWPWRTIVLEGEYIEHRPADPDDPAGETFGYHRQAGMVGDWREAEQAHRVELIDGQPALTLFITAPREREWGFWCDWGWRHWREFVAPDGGTTGRGCG